MFQTQSRYYYHVLFLRFNVHLITLSHIFVLRLIYAIWRNKNRAPLIKIFPLPNLFSAYVLGPLIRPFAFRPVGLVSLVSHIVARRLVAE